MLLNEEDFEEIEFEIPAVETEIIPETELQPAGPEQGTATGVANLIHDLLIDENEAIQQYNNAVANMVDYPELQKIMQDIAGEEFAHIGELEKALEIISPNAANIEEGEVESEENLDIIDQDAPVDEALCNKDVKEAIDNGYKNWTVWVDGVDKFEVTAKNEEEAYELAERGVGYFDSDTIIEVEPTDEILDERYRYKSHGNLDDNDKKLLKAAIKYVCIWYGDALLTYASGEHLVIDDDNRRAYGDRNILKMHFETSKEIGDPVVRVDRLDNGYIANPIPLKQELLGYFTEDTKKKPSGKWVNKGNDGEHGEFSSKKEADNQRKAMFANGFKESLLNYSSIVLNEDGSVNYKNATNNYYYASMSDLKEDICNELDSIKV